MVEESGFAPYFLVVHDVVEFARRRGIYHNLRGSGASSYLAYLLGISRLNPVKYDLYFERFLNRGRPDPPDFDLDFDSSRRDEVLDYVLKRYYGSGKTGAAYVCSLKNYRARSALYETARAFGVPPEEARSMSKKVPMFAEPDYLREMPPRAGYLEVWKLASELSGVFAEISLHVGGVILTPAPADRFLPLEESAKGLLMCHYDRDTVEEPNSSSWTFFPPAALRPSPKPGRRSGWNTSRRMTRKPMPFSGKPGPSAVSRWKARP